MAWEFVGSGVWLAWCQWVCGVGLCGRREQWNMAGEAFSIGWDGRVVFRLPVMVFAKEPFCFLDIL